MTLSDNVSSMSRLRDKAAEDLANARIAASEASARSATATKDEKVALARAAAVARTRVSECSRALKEAEKALRKAEKEAEKQAEENKKAAAAQARAQFAKERERLAEEDPFMAFDINWPALGAWLADRARNRVCFVEGVGWGEWRGSHWEFSSKPSASLLDRVRASYRKDKGTISSRLNANPRSALYMLEHAQGALTQPRHLFNSPAVAHLLAFQNATVDLRTGETMPHDPEHYMTGCMQCDFDEGADIDRVERAFARFWPNDPETAKMFQTSLGYSATGETSAKRVFFMIGNQDDALSNGDNGKSLVQNALTRLFGLGRGGWGTAVKPGIIIDTGDRDANSHDGGKTPLIWRRFAMASEPRKGATIDSGEFNRISGGDVQTARPPHGEDSVEFVPFASLWISMNTVIRFKSWDKATRIRLTPFPFRETFYDPGMAPEGSQEKEVGLKEWLESDEGMQALALYVVRGAMTFYACNDGRAGNFPNSTAVIDFRESILRAANPYAEMFERWFVFSPDVDLARSAASALLGEHLGARPKDHERAIFLEALSGQRVTTVKIKGIYYLRGVGLTDEGRRVAQIRGQGSAEIWRRKLQMVAAE